MINALDVYLWGTRIGSAHCRPGHPIVQFEYSDEIRRMTWVTRIIRLVIGRAVTR